MIEVEEPLSMKSFIKNMIREGLIGEDYPMSFSMDKFKSLNTFKQRISYCQKNLKNYIGEGSARMVFMIDDTKVLKLAMNEKGLAQNKSELELSRNPKYKDIVALTIDSDPKNLWIEMELARKANNNDFVSILGFDITSLLTYIKYVDMKVNIGDEKKAMFYYNLLNQENDNGPSFDIDFFNNNLFAKELAAFMIDTKTPSHEITKANSYGVVNRNGKDSIVLVDYGLVGDVYTNHYIGK